MKVHLIAGLISLFLFNGCTTESSETKTVIIENALENQITVKFYNRGFSSGKKSLTIDGPGTIFNETKTDLGAININQVLEADSILLFFDNVYLESHDLETNQPRGNSLFDGSAYVQDGKTWTYIIDNKNLENAVPCNGSCD